MELVSAFTTVLRVPNLSSPEHLMTVLEETDCFRKEELAKIARKTEGRRIWVGIKKLLAYIDLARQTDMEHRVIKFLSKLEDENCLEGI